MIAPTESLRVAVDARVLVMKPTGIGRYLRSLLHAMAINQPDYIEPVFFTHEPISDYRFWPGTFEQHIVSFPGPMLLRPLWDHVLLPRAIRKKGPFDLFFSPLSITPRRLKCPSVAMIYDLAFMRLPDIQPWKYRFYWKRALQRTAAKANRLIAISESTKKDLVECFPGAEPRTRVVYCGCDPQFQPAEKDDQGDEARRYGRYLLAVGTIEPRKNYPFLLDVFEKTITQPGCEDLKLVIAGTRGWSSLDLKKEAERFGGRLIWLDYVEQERLPALYRDALALLFPTRYEGFGLPALEAMACGTPVLASDTSSLPEVVGQAGCLLPPGDADAWVQALTHLVNDSEQRERLRECGLEQAGHFRWSDAAESVISIFREVSGK